MKMTSENFLVAMIILFILVVVVIWLNDNLTPYRITYNCTEDYRCPGQSEKIEEPLCQACKIKEVKRLNYHLEMYELD